MAAVGEPMQVSSHTVDKVAKAKLTLENYYSNLVTQHEERENRYVLILASGFVFHVHNENHCSPFVTSKVIFPCVVSSI
jgi:hypothetical protein